MDIKRLAQVSEVEWRIEPTGKMQVPAVLFASEQLVRDMDEKVYEQICNVATLPGIQKAAYAMPDAHWGYGFPIGGVAAFDPDAGGIVSAGGVGFDISCGVRNLQTGLKLADVLPLQQQLANALFETIPVGLGKTGALKLSLADMDAMLKGGARWAVNMGFGEPQDLNRIEEYGCMPGAKASDVSDQAKNRQRDEMGTLGSGNHYLELQRIVAIYDEITAKALSIELDDIIVSIHCGSRGLGHQIGTEYLKKMVIAAPQHGISLPDRELACAPILSPLGQAYLGAMRGAINCALANRQIITHLVRQVFEKLLPQAQLQLLYDVSHNTCKIEQHLIDGKIKQLFVHRKGATRAFGPGHPDLPPDLRPLGQPVLIGGTMGTASYILIGTEQGMARSFGSACHGAGRSMSRNQATRQWQGRAVVDELSKQGIVIRSPSMRGIAEEAPGAYKDVDEVVEAADQAKLTRKVAKLAPVICIKG